MLETLTNTLTFGGSIMVQLVFSFAGLDYTKHDKMLLFV